MALVAACAATKRSIRASVRATGASAAAGACARAASGPDGPPGARPLAGSARAQPAARQVRRIGRKKRMRASGGLEEGTDVTEVGRTRAIIRPMMASWACRRPGRWQASRPFSRSVPRIQVRAASGLAPHATRPGAGRPDGLQSRPGLALSGSGGCKRPPPPSTVSFGGTGDPTSGKRGGRAAPRSEYPRDPWRQPPPCSCIELPRSQVALEPSGHSAEPFA